MCIRDSAYAVGQILSVFLFHPGLGIEQVHLGRGSRLEQINYALCLGGKVREGISRSGLGLLREQPGKRGGAQSRSPVAQKHAPVEKILGRIQIGLGKEEILKSFILQKFSPW